MASEERKASYDRKRKELEEHCVKCIMCSAVRCDSCTWGKKLRWLQTEYSDVTGWSHDLWKEGK